MIPRISKRDLVALFFILAVQAVAQSDRGSISGSVADASGGAVPNAKITATNLDTGEKRHATTGSNGQFLFPELKAQPWRVDVEAAGFKTATVDRVQVAVQITQRVDIILALGQVSDSITVEDVASAIQSDNATNFSVGGGQGLGAEIPIHGAGNRIVQLRARLTF